MDITELKRNTDPRAGRHPWEKARAGFISFLLRRFSAGNGTLLDLGSGDAYLLSALSEKKTYQQYLAVDTAYTPELISGLRKIPGNESIRFFKITGEIPPQEKADTCLLLDVLEHCEDDLAVLKQSTGGGLTTADARFFITVPAFQGLFSKHDNLLQHHRRYSRKQLRRLCEKAGLEPIATGYFFFSLLPARALQLLAEKLKLREPKHTLDGWKGGAFLSHLIYAILRADSRICYLLSRTGLHLPGLSAYAICKKQPS